MNSSSDRASWIVRLAARREWLAWTNAGLFSLWFAAALLAFQQLPERVPMHFTPSGTPTRWETLTLTQWLLLPLLTLVIVLLLPLLERVHQWLNRHYRIAPAEPGLRARWLHLRRAYLDLCAALLILAMGLLHLGVWLVTTGRAASLPPAVLAGSFGAFAAILLLIIPLHRSTTALQEQH